MQQVNKVDLLNVGLIALSFVLAIILPFKLFLFSYVILGPLHYMTEIGWLRERKFFSKSSTGVAFLLGLGVLLTISVIVLFASSLPFMSFLTETSWYPSLAQFCSSINPAMVFIAFTSAFVFALVSDKKKGLVIIGISFLLAILLYNNQQFNMVFGVFIPTILHVSLFTILFMIYGALKSKSKLGMGNAVLFTFLCFSFFFINFKAFDYAVSNELLDRLIKSTFIEVNADFVSFFGLHSGDQYNVMSNIALQMQAFLSFVYTYHYLNWFSKTKIINWHKVSKQWLAIAAFIWIGAIALYFYNMMLGLLVLAFLSLVHVFLEFPLNHLSIHGIYTELRTKWSA